MLHIVNKSPHGNPALRDCLRFCDRNDVLLLIEDGVYAAIGEHPESLLAVTPNICVLSEDLSARGLLGRIDSRVTAVDYAGFVQLCCEHHPIQSWF